MMRKFWYAGDHPIKQELYDKYEVAWLILVGYIMGILTVMGVISLWT